MTFETSLIYILLFISLYFEVFVLISFIDYKKKQKSETRTKNVLLPQNLPSVTITVPCYNEEKTLAKTITSLLALDYPTAKLTITIVNDGSTDTTSHIAHTFAKAHTHITAIDKENGGKASAMNIALHKSTSDFIGCLDADSVVDPQALRHIIATFSENTSIAAVVPAIIPTAATNILQMMQRAEYSASVFIRKALSIIDAIVITPGPFSIYKMSIVKELGGWHHAHGTEDLQMGLRLQEARHIIANQPLAMVETVTPNTLSSLYHQRLRWMYGLIMNAWDYRHMIGNKKYGNAGMLILPIALLSILGAIIVFSMLLIKIFTLCMDVLIKIFTIGFSFTLPNIDIFYLPINTFLLLTLTFIAIWLFMLRHGARLAKTPIHYRDIFIYLSLYGFIAPLWLSGALARAITKRESEWKVVR